MAAPAGTPWKFAAIEQPISPRDAAVRAWRVLHVCETARQVWPVVEGQLSAGMRPSVLTPNGFRVVVEAGPPPGERSRALSLLEAWHDVRGWRESMLQASHTSSAEIVHAHTFASGMAGVRNCPVVVYDVQGFVEEVAAQQAAPERRSWLARSFRVAEQFVITRASAVVVHSGEMRMRAFERGALPGSLFVIPPPAIVDGEGPAPFPRELRDDVVFFAADVCAAKDAIDGNTVSLLQAFSTVAAECDNAYLILQAAPEAMQSVFEVARSLRIAGRVRLTSTANVAAALAAADVVICGGREESAAIAALQRGRTLLAADVPAMRDVTAEGRGCLWYDAHDPRDLARRAKFLARNPNFRHVLALAGFEHLRATRSPEAVGRRYDEVYRHAMLRRRTLNSSTGASLVPIRACI